MLMKWLRALPRLSFKDQLTVLLSVTAIVLSAVSLYFQFFYAKRDLRMGVVGYSHDAWEASDPNAQIKLAFVNAGTQQVLISSIELLLDNIYKEAKAPVPITLQPGDIKVIEVEAQFHEASVRRALGHDATPTVPKEGKFEVLAHVYLVTASGEQLTKEARVLTVSFKDGHLSSISRSNMVRIVP